MKEYLLPQDDVPPFLAKVESSLTYLVLEYLSFEMDHAENAMDEIGLIDFQHRHDPTAVGIDGVSIARHDKDRCFPPAMWAEATILRIGS